MDFGMLKLTGIARQRGGRRRVVDDVSLQIPAGTSCALLGPAGSGKSVLMRIMAGFEAPSSGVIEWAGVTLDGIPPHRRGFGIVSQPDALLPDLTLAHNIAVPLVLRGVRRRDRVGPLETILEQMQLTAVAGLKPARATPAQRQRAILARACAFGPRLLLLDEPFSAQDESEREALLAGLRQLHVMLGATIVLATRQASVAMAVADQIAVLRGGILVQTGSGQTLFEQPATDFVAGMLGETNALAGVVQAVEDGIVTVRLAAGPLVEGQAGAALSPGQVCTVCIRPERIAIAPGRAAGMGEMAVDATVIDARLNGPVLRLRLLIGSGAALSVIRPAGSGTRGLAAGDPAAIAWQPHHAVVFARPTG